MRCGSCTRTLAAALELETVEVVQDEAEVGNTHLLPETVAEAEAEEAEKEEVDWGVGRALGCGSAANREELLPAFAA